MKSDEKYRKIIEVLRESTPEINCYDEIEEAVIREISKKHVVTGFFDFLFSWIYIRWVRRALITASFALVGFFTWQQHSIIDQIGELHDRIVEDNAKIIENPSGSIERRQMLLKYARQMKGGFYVDAEDLNKILDSLNSVSIKYRDLVRIIDNDPQLRDRLDDILDKNSGSEKNRRL
ncbi:MAG TPA: hypothetical protein VK213_09215 [Bacteroidales bacterium]|nr:hypothetical protein [Bacteroidales bacterium]